MSVAFLWFLAACTDDAPVQDVVPAPGVPFTTADVDVFVGTGGPGFRVGSLTPAAGLPTGLVKVGPDTSLAGFQAPFYHCGGYYFDDTHIDGFSHLHLPGVGVPDYGTVLFMPMDGWDASRRASDGWMQTFDHAEEYAAPGRYSVTMGDGIGVRLAATRHAAHHRYTYPEDVSDPTFVVDLAHVLDGTSLGGHVEVDAARGVVRGWSRTAGGFTSDLKTYVYAEVDGGIAAFGTWGDDEGETGRAAADGVLVGAWIRPASGRSVDVRVGLSLTSTDAAEANLRAELPEQDIAVTESAAEATWNEALDTVRFAGGTAEQRTIAATALYHALLMPQEHGDADGGYVGFDGVRHSAEDWKYHSDLSLWDTYRTANPLYAVLYPGLARDIARSLLAMREEGGAFPRWPAAGGEGGSMIGAPADIVMAETYLRGVTDIRMEAAWPLLDAQARGQVDAGYNTRTGTEAIDTLGWIPADEQGGSVAWHEELAWADASMSALAADLGETDAAAFFGARADTFVNTWDPAVGFFHGRNRDGSFEAELNPVAWEEEYVEGNAWQYLWMPFPRWETLAETLGGNEAARAKLTTFFEGAEAEGVLDFPQTYYWHGNEPDIHTPWLFTLWGDADATWRWVRWVAATHYAVDPVGLAGNDDGGTLSAWYLWAGMGLYPVAGTDQYVVSPPIFETVEIPVSGGIFTMQRVGNGDHVAGVTLDGETLTQPIVRHAQLRAGGLLVVTLSD